MLVSANILGFLNVALMVLMCEPADGPFCFTREEQERPPSENVEVTIRLSVDRDVDPWQQIAAFLL
jgi:hypothetical protein